MRRINLSKKKHEASRFINRELLRLQNYRQITERIDLFSTPVTNEGVGAIYIPSIQIFERLTPSSNPVGIVFIDGSFLVIKEIFHYAYASEDAVEPGICHLDYSFHYQRPLENSFFRYDYHPDVGDLATHPLYHLHAAGWRDNAPQLPSAPRFPVSLTTIDKVLELIRINFFAE
jgi:hypothetical protein